MTHDTSKTKGTLTSLAAEIGLLPADAARQREEAGDTALQRNTSVLGEKSSFTHLHPDRPKAGHDMAREAAEHEIEMRRAKEGTARHVDGIMPVAATNMPPD